MFLKAPCTLRISEAFFVCNFEFLEPSSRKLLRHLESQKLYVFHGWTPRHFLWRCCPFVLVNYLFVVKCLGTSHVLEGPWTLESQMLYLCVVLNVGKHVLDGP